MRIFLAVAIDDDIRARIARFLDGVHGFAPEARWVRPESLHVTLKFIGEKSEAEIEEIKKVLATITLDSFPLSIRGLGFFPSARAPRLFWIGVEADERLNALASTVDEKLASLNIPKEEHAFHPHLTLARGAGGAGSQRKQKGNGPNRGFQHLQEKLAALSAPEFGTMTARKFILYQSELLRGGSKYIELAAFALH